MRPLDRRALDEEEELTNTLKDLRALVEQTNKKIWDTENCLNVLRIDKEFYFKRLDGIEL